MSFASTAGPGASELPCPCGTGEQFARCCEPFVSGEAHAPTALQLMRSRYTAYAVGAMDYVYATWASETRPSLAELEDSHDPDFRWLRLIIESTVAGGPFDSEGTVTFEAIGRGEDGRVRMLEESRFEKRGKTWVYVEGRVS